jgi:hypothetical protein
MKTKLLATVSALMLFSINATSAATYTVDIKYNLLDGTLFPPSVFQEFESHDIPVSLPTLSAGDVINTTINFTRGLALTLNDTNPFNFGRQMLGAIFLPNNSAGGIVSVSSQLSLLKAHGDILTPGVVTGRSDCATCVAAVVNQNFTDTSFSFRGLNIVTTILNILQPFGSDRMHFQVFAGEIEITHGASSNPVSLSAASPLAVSDPIVTPLPAALPLFATGLGALGLFGWMRKRKAVVVAA